MSQPVTVSSPAGPVAGSVDGYMTTRQIATYSGRHVNTVLLAFHEYDATKDTKEPRGLKGFQRTVYAPWRAHADDVERWIHNLPPTRGVRKFATTERTGTK